jgi:hypothetical protein
MYHDGRTDRWSERAQRFGCIDRPTSKLDDDPDQQPGLGLGRAEQLRNCGVDLRTQRWFTRRRLEAITTWAPPLQLSLVTDDPIEAAEWFEALGTIAVEGLVAKGKVQPVRVRTSGLAQGQFCWGQQCPGFRFKELPAWSGTRTCWSAREQHLSCTKGAGSW